MSVDIKIPPKSKCKYGAVQEAIRKAPQPRSLERYGDGDIVFAFGENKKVIKMETSPQVPRNNYFSFKQKIMAQIHEQRKERWVAIEARKLIYDQEMLEEEELIDLEGDLALTDSDSDEDKPMKEEDKENGEHKVREEESDDKNGESKLPDDCESQDAEIDEEEDEDDEGDADEEVDIEDQSSNQSDQMKGSNKPTQKENEIVMDEQSVSSSMDSKEEEIDTIVNRKRKPKVIDDEDESDDDISYQSQNLLSKSEKKSSMKPKSKKNVKTVNILSDDEVSMDDIISAIGSPKLKNRKRTESNLSDIEEDYDAENEEEGDDNEDDVDEVDSEEEAEEIEREEKRSKNSFVNDEARDVYDDEEEDEEPNEDDIAMINDEDEDEDEEDEEEDEDEDEESNDQEDEDKENKNEDEEEKEVKPSDFFFNEAEVSGTDSSDDEDGEDDIVRELIDEEADKLDSEKVRKDVAQTYHKELLNEDKRVLLQLQERYLEDGDLHSDHKRSKKFRWGTASSAWLDNARDSDSSSNDEDDDDDDDDENIPVFRLKNTSLPLSSTENKMSGLSRSGSVNASLPSTTLTLNKPSSSITSYLVRDKQLNNILSTKRSDPFDRHRGMGIKKLKPGSSGTKSLFDLYK